MRRRPGWNSGELAAGQITGGEVHRQRTIKRRFGTLKQWLGATHFLTRSLAEHELEHACLQLETGRENQ